MRSVTFQNEGKMYQAKKSVKCRTFEFCFALKKEPVSQQLPKQPFIILYSKKTPFTEMNKSDFLQLISTSSMHILSIESIYVIMSMLLLREGIIRWLNYSHISDGSRLFAWRRSRLSVTLKDSWRESSALAVGQSGKLSSFNWRIWTIANYFCARNRFWSPIEATSNLPLRMLPLSFRMLAPNKT